ncbi:CGNR zinc finger domain-containing protein [Bacillus horti]|uniref:Zinc finger CGNR domain-containing protein n=1 Tax=Caldalkalibacillus horti TaxID=77523 RepID=A0ABT9VZU0_9BACI|nr:CGNR zinc finger domain-containing protein [Bacillus horti]MDQ0166510.1 hypothetical protein [Bacillus horti]
MRYYNEKWNLFLFDVLNSYDPFYADPERLGSTEKLSELLVKYQLFQEESLTTEQLGAVQLFRDSLRFLILKESDETLVKFLSEYESRAPITTRLQAAGEGKFTLIYEQLNKGGLKPLEDRILAICSHALGRMIVDFGRSRLKSCTSTPCEEIFVDQSKNGMQRFCSKRCSTRYHVKKHREQA